MGAEPRTRPDPRAELLAGIPWDVDPLAVTEDDLVERRAHHPRLNRALMDAWWLEDESRANRRPGRLSRLVAKVKGWLGR